MKSIALDNLEKIKRQTLKALHDQCTPEQQHLFRLMYQNVGGIENMPDGKIDWAIQQCENTLNKAGIELNLPYKVVA